MLAVKDLHVSIKGEEILHGVNLHIPDGEVHALFGPNGSGKSVMMMTIMGWPEYEITRGGIFLDGRDVTGLSMDERARLGLGISEQKPPVLKGVKLRDLVNLIIPEKRFAGAYSEAILSAIDIERFLDRGINDGLSGGESKQTELFLLILANPKLLILDEPDSGVDPVHLKEVGRLINTVLRNKPPAGSEPWPLIFNERKAGLISTHSSAILEYVHADKAHLMMKGNIKCSGDPDLMMNHIKDRGYNYCIRCLAQQP